MLKRLFTPLGFPLIIIIFIIAGCSGAVPSEGTHVWIDVPIDGLTIPVDQPIHIEGHAASSEGLAQVEIWIDGALTHSIDTTSVADELVYYNHSWTPPGMGHYTIQAMAIGASGTASEADFVRVLVGDVVSPTPVDEEDADKEPTPTPTEVVEEEMPATTVELWVEPAEVQAGECANIYWRVENAQSVRLGNSEVPAEGHYEACHCSNELYRLTVTDLDGAEEEHQAIIQVTGSCDAAPEEGEEPPPDDSDPPPPSTDTTAPPAPTLNSPSNGSDLGCVSSTALSWSAVSDESGIAEYRIEVQRHAGDNNWSTAPGTPLSGLGSTSTSISVECGWTYRWRVQAVDGAGNVGAWSGWFQFNVPLI
ncbi:MAG: hypothetical protein DWQ07_08485 [Chloroflexi bacterium]|nr:MAG: hypothetical protein DWQ07_08485 [Chloroflexota bacterium]MBL1193251.1 hypothetical protein [Chloroflexota bacterium]